VLFILIALCDFELASKLALAIELAIEIELVLELALALELAIANVFLCKPWHQRYKKSARISLRRSLTGTWKVTNIRDVFIPVSHLNPMVICI
jgi:hypothetical protein